MSITDELREIAAKTECANGRCEKLYRGDLEHIADRIDAEYKKACDDAWDNGYEADYLGIEKWLTEHPQVMEHHGWIRLPKDADGEYIHVGDVLTDGEYTFKVFELAAFGDGSWSIRNEDGNAWAACDVTHHHEPTIEDVLREMVAAYMDTPLDDSNDGEFFAEYAAKLRLAMLLDMLDSLDLDPTSHVDTGAVLRRVRREVSGR